MEKYEEYDKTYNDAELNDIINNYNEQIDVVHNDEKLIKILEKKSNRTEQEEEKLKKISRRPAKRPTRSRYIG